MAMVETPPNNEEEDGPPGKMTIPKVLTYDEIDRFLSVIDDLEDLVACRVMLFGGLRVNEACELKVRDIRHDPPAIFIEQGKGGKDRYAPIDIATYAIARCYARSAKLQDNSPLFSMSKRTLQRHVEQIYERAGITWGATCHTLRHTCATWQLDMGIPLEVVKNNLGHTDIQTTQIYLHLNIRQRSRTYRDATRFGT